MHITSSAASKGYVRGWDGMEDSSRLDPIPPRSVPEFLDIRHVINSTVRGACVQGSTDLHSIALPLEILIINALRT